MRRALAAAVLLATLAGCTSSEGPDQPVEPEFEEQWTQADNDLSRCVEVLFGTLRPISEAQALLPEGFTAADFADPFGLPAPTGRALVAINGIVCEHTAVAGGAAAFGELIVTIDPPNPTNASLDSVPRVAYVLAQISGNASLLRTFETFRIPAIEAAVEAEISAAPAGGTGTLVARDESGELYRAEIAAPTNPPESSASRLWHADAAGLTHIDYSWQDGPFALGTVISCSVRSGSLIHEALGTTDCTNAPTIGAISLGLVDIEATYHRLQGSVAN